MRILQQQVVRFNMHTVRQALEQINGAYALIILEDSANPGGDSHAVCAYVGGNGEDACFFDPNYGEYAFSDRDDFFTFFHFFTNFVYHRYFRFDTCEIVRVWTV